MELRVAIHDPRTGADEEVFFRTSPIRIGRNGLNDLLIDEPSVSQWHAQLAWDERGVWFTDVGSSNGSSVDAARVVPNHPIVIGDQTLLGVGPVVLRADVVGASEATSRARRMPLGGAMPDELRTAISTIDVIGPLGGGSDDEAPTEAHDVEVATALASSAISQLQYLRGALAALEPVRAAYLDELREQVAALPTASRAKILPQLARELPELSRAPEFIELAAQSGVEGAAVAELTVREWLERIVGAPLTGPHGEEVADARVLARLAALLQTFAQSLFELMRAKEHVVRELGLGSGEGAPRSGQDVLAYLCDFRVDGEERVSALARVFAELAMHQIAMVAATREGVRALLDDLSPAAVTQRTREVRHKRGALADLLPLTGVQLWDAYRATHADVAESDRFARHVFGARFGRSYHAMIGRQPPAASEPVPPRRPAEPPVGPRTVPEQPAVPVTRCR